MVHSLGAWDQILTPVSLRLVHFGFLVFSYGVALIFLVKMGGVEFLYGEGIAFSLIFGIDVFGY